MVAFCRNLRRHAAKLGRVELAGGANDFGIYASSWSWIDRTNARLDLERVVRHLSKPSTTVVMLRAAGFEWKEIARLLGTTPARRGTVFGARSQICENSSAFHPRSARRIPLLLDTTILSIRSDSGSESTNL